MTNNRCVLGLEFHCLMIKATEAVLAGGTADRSTEPERSMSIT